MIEAQILKRPPQRSQRASFPLTTAALEQALGQIDRYIGWRSGRLQNRKRLNRLLLLMQLELNGDANRSNYKQTIRDWLISNDGRPRGRRRAVTDLAGVRSLRD